MPTMPTASDLLINRSRLCLETGRAMQRLLQVVGDVTERTVLRDEIRVPLDVPREGVRSLQWTPLALSPLCCSNSNDFVLLMEFLRDTVLRHCRSPLPVLMDVNLFYRHMKLCYAKRYSQWRYREHFRFCPPLYGAWHNYKHSCVLGHRYFHSQLTFLQHGCVRVGDKFPTKPRLRTLEMLYAAILLIPVDVRQQLRGRVSERTRRLQAHRSHMRIWEQFHSRTRVMSVGDREAAAATRLKDAEEEARIVHDLQQAEAMERLVNGYVPALFAIGWHVRNCNWGGREPGTAADAQECLLFCACLMLSLVGNQRARTEYLRTLCVALLTWQGWHSGLYGAMFSEEIPEASLSRLGQLLQSDPQVIRVEDAENVFLTVPTGVQG